MRLLLPVPPVHLHAPARSKRSPTSASSLSLDGDGVSPPGRTVAFFALKTRTDKPAAHASSLSSLVQGCPRASAYALRKASDCSTLAEVFGPPGALNTVEAAPAIAASRSPTMLSQSCTTCSRLLTQRGFWDSQSA